MRKFIAGFMLFSIGLSASAGENNTRVWANIYSLWDEVNAMKEQLSKSPMKIGDLYHGGIVFYVDESGQHGLVASTTDLNDGKGISWRNGDSGNKTTNAKGDGLFAGDTNTKLIIAEQTIDRQKGLFAALITETYSANANGDPCTNNNDEICYGNWYLPSSYELSLLQKHLPKISITNFVPDFYWSSTESSVKNAVLINFATGEKVSSDKSNAIGHVRAISQF